MMWLSSVNGIFAICSIHIKGTTTTFARTRVPSEAQAA